MGIEKYNLDSEVYQNLTENLEAKNASNNKKWTFYLVFCSFIVCLSSFQFGYNVGSVNSITPLVKEYFEQNYYKTIFFDKLKQFEEGKVKLANGTARYEAGLKLFNEKKAYLEEKETELLAAEARRDNYLDVMFSFNEEKIAEAKRFKALKEIEIRKKYNTSVENFMKIARTKIDEGKVKLAEGRQKLQDAQVKIKEGNEKIADAKIKIAEGRAKLDIVTDIMWAFFNVLFIIGGMIGAFTSKHVADRFGYKGGILFHHLFTFAGTVVTVLPFYTPAPAVLVKLGRFLYGIQGGMTCTLVPPYLNEISPFGLKNKTGTLHSISLAFGILVSQILGYTQILGTPDLFHILLALSVIPAIIGTLLLLIISPDSPRTLLENNQEDKAQKVLKKLRNSNTVNGEIQLLYKEMDDSSTSDKIRFQDLITDKAIRWPVFCGVMLQIAQQLSGINIVFFYSRILFEAAGVPNEYIQYAVSLTGLVNFLALAVLLPLVDKMRRKKTLVISMILMAIDLTCLVIFMRFQKEHCFFAYGSVACVLVFLVLFAAGLNSVPAMFVNECFEKDARSSPIFLCIVANWIAALVVTLDFPFLIKFMQGYTFIISVLTLLITLVLVVRKMPETKGKNAAQIQAAFR